MKYFKHAKIQYFIVVFLISHFSLFIFTTPVQAHVLKTDGSVGAVLHVSPDDDPIAGVPTDFFFELKDKNNTFTPENCDCVAQVLQNGKVIVSQPLFATNTSPSLEDASFRYVLPQKDIYTIQLQGSPKGDDNFKPFTLSWDIRVDRERASSQASETSNTNEQNVRYVVLLAAVVIVVGLILSKKKKPAKTK